MMPLKMRAAALWVALALTTALGACDRTGPQWNSKDIAGLVPDLRFNLTAETGKPVDAAAFREDVTLLYFGFTNCPDVCPVTLNLLSQAIDELPTAKRDGIKVLFVSVDPKRDTPKRLAAYTEHFGPEFVGLTGPQETLREMTKTYRVTYGYGDPDVQGNYNVSHSSAVFAFDRQGKARLLIRSDQSKAGIAADLRQLLDV